MQFHICLCSLACLVSTSGSATNLKSHSFPPFGKIIYELPEFRMIITSVYEKYNLVIEFFHIIHLPPYMEFFGLPEYHL